jgi:hypothetical protein
MIPPQGIGGGGKVDITDRPDRLLGNIDILDNDSRKLGYVKCISDSFTTDYDKLLVSNTITKLFLPGKFRIANQFIIENVRPDDGDFTKTRHIITPYKIHYVYDKRHSHDLDLTDNTKFTIASLTPAEVLKIDYGQTINSTYLYIKIELSASNGIGKCDIEISENDSDWTQIHSVSVSGSQIFELTTSNKTFRYLRFLLYNPVPYFSASLYVYKIIIYTNVM